METYKARGHVGLHVSFGAVRVESPGIRFGVHGFRNIAPRVSICI